MIKLSNDRLTDILLTSGKMSVASARATTSRAIHDRRQAIRAKSDHAVDVEPVRIR